MPMKKKNNDKDGDKSLAKINGEKLKKQPGLLQLVLAGVLVFLLGGAIVIGYLTLVGIPGGEAAKDKEKQKEEIHVATMDLGSIIVNLADPGGTRFLKVGVVLEYPENEKLAEELEKKKAEITDLVINQLRSKTVEEIRPISKIDTLKNELINVINRRLVEGKVTRVFFTEFIIQ